MEEPRREPAAAARRFSHEITRRHSDDLVTDEGASSTLFVGNLSGNVRYKDLMSLFKRYGDIEASNFKCRNIYLGRQLCSFIYSYPGLVMKLNC